jgi:helix-turn-helix protein
MKGAAGFEFIEAAHRDVHQSDVWQMPAHQFECWHPSNASATTSGSLPRYLKPLLDAQQVADCLGLTKQVINKWARQGLIRAVNLPGGMGRPRLDGTGRARYRFKPDDLDEFMRLRTTGEKLSRRLSMDLSPIVRRYNK